MFFNENENRMFSAFWARYPAGGLDFAGKNQYAGKEKFYLE
jgi:hypothetical protein